MRTFISRCSADSLEPDSPLDSASTLVLTFASRETLEATDVHAQLRGAFPSAALAGCSTAGHFLNDELTDDDVLVAAVQFEHSQLRQATVDLDNTDESFLVGQKLANELATDELQAVLVLSDGLHCNGTELARGLSSVFGPEVDIFGGLAADGDAFGSTLVLGPDGVRSAQVTAIGISGAHVMVGTASGGGWDPFGPERTITASAGADLHELDGEPALELYRRYLGDRAEELPGSALLFPLTIRNPADNQDAEQNQDATVETGSLVRTVLGVDPATNTMTFAGDMPLGHRAQLMRANFDGLVDGAEGAAHGLGRSGETVGDSLCLAVSCVGRRLVLGSRTEDELDAVVAELDERTPLVGFYSYGELAAGVSGRCELHNQTMTLALISESAPANAAAS